MPVKDARLSDLAVLFLDAYRDTKDYEGESLEVQRVNFRTS